jgi:hypothetical protein
MPEDIRGAAQLLEELAIQFDILDETMNFDAYKLVILSESFKGGAAFIKKLEKYLAKGGAVIACGKALLDNGNFPSCFGVEYTGDNEYYPDFIVAEGTLAKGLESGNEYVIYKQGPQVKAAGGKTILKARAPYFPRKGERFCSHRYTPSAEGKPYAAAVRNGNLIYFSHPLFLQYHHNAPRWCKTIISNAIDVLMPQRLIRHNGPSTLSVSVLEQVKKRRYTVHLLSYIPVRKSAAIDIIEERTAVRDIKLCFNFPKPIRKAFLVPVDSAPAGKELSIEKDKSVTIPVVDGYAILELSY